MIFAVVQHTKNTTTMSNSKSLLSRISLPQRILIGLILGTLLGLLVPQATAIGILGSLFVGALKAIAPLLVFVLVISSLCHNQTGFDRRFGFVIFEYLLTTLWRPLSPSPPASPSPSPCHWRG